MYSIGLTRASVLSPPLRPGPNLKTVMNERSRTWRSSWQEGPQEVVVGWFDLDRPVEPRPEDNCVCEPLPEQAGRYKAEMRLRGANQIEVRVLVERRWYGLYRLQPKDPSRLHQQCPQCSHAFDQDLEACRNMLAAWKASVAMAAE